MGKIENNSRVRRKKVISKKNRVTTQGRKEEEVGTLLLGDDKSNVIVNYVFINLVFVLKLSELNGYLKGYLKSRINKLLRKNKQIF